MTESFSTIEISEGSGTLPIRDGSVVIFCSDAYDDAFIRADGNGVSSFHSNGAGQVNCQYYTQQNLRDHQIKTWERFTAHHLSDSLYFFQSYAWPKCYLRLDGSGVSTSNPIGKNLNLQYYDAVPTDSALWECFNVVSAGNARLRLQSNAFPSCYVAINGSGLTGFNPAGGGSVKASANQDSETRLTGYYINY